MPPASAVYCLFLSTIFLSSCSPLSAIDALVPGEGYDREVGVSYGEGPRQKLDIYSPVQSDVSKPIIVFFYGGSWRNGERELYRFVGQTFASIGYTVVIPDYRLYPEVGFPEFLRDSAKAVAWTSRHLSTEGAHGSGMVLIGHSAGAYIAALLALDPRYIEETGVSPGVIGNVVGLAGPYAFDPLRYRSTRAIFETAADPDMARPVTFARSGVPAMLLLHGADDRTVLPRNSEEMAQLLSAEGNRVVYRTLDGVGHVEILLALASPFRYLAPVADLTVSFIEADAERQAAH